MRETDKTELFERRTPWRAVMSLALPTMLGQLSTIIYNLTDTYFVSATNDADQIAAVSLSMPVSLIVMSLGAVFGYGGASLIARLLGAKQEGRVRNVSAYCFYMGVLLCVPIMLVGLLLLGPIAGAVGAVDGTLAPTKSYLMVLLIGTPVMLFSNMLIHMIRGEGSAKQASFGLILGTVVNIALDPIFISVLGLGVTGAAVATVIGNAASVTYYVLYFFGKRTSMSLSPKHFTLEREIQRGVIFVGIPGGMVTILMSLSNIVLNNILASYGSTAVAGYGIASKVSSFGVMLIVGLAQGVQPLIGYNFAAKNFPRLHSVMRFSFALAAGLGTFFALIFVFLRGVLVGVFVSEADLVQMGSEFLLILALSAPVLGVTQLVSSFFQGTGFAGRSLAITVSRQLALFLPLLFVLNALFGRTGVSAAQPAADALCAVLATGLYLRFWKKRQSLDAGL